MVWDRASTHAVSRQQIRMRRLKCRVTSTSQRRLWFCKHLREGLQFPWGLKQDLLGRMRAGRCLVVVRARCRSGWPLRADELGQFACPTLVVGLLIATSLVYAIKLWGMRG